jgi:hypothetical protein
MSGFWRRFFDFWRVFEIRRFLIFGWNETILFRGGFTFATKNIVEYGDI